MREICTLRSMSGKRKRSAFRHEAQVTASLLDSTNPDVVVYLVTAGVANQRPTLKKLADERNCMPTSSMRQSGRSTAPQRLSGESALAGIID